MQSENDIDHALKEALTLLRTGDPELALAKILPIAKWSHDFPRQNQYARLARLLSPRLPRMPDLRVAFLASATIDPLIEALNFWLLLAGFRLQYWNAPFDTWRQQAMSVDSGLYAFKPDVVWLFLTCRDIHIDALGALVEENKTAENEALRDVLSVVHVLCEKCRVPVLVNNAELPAVRMLGNLEGQFPTSLSRRRSRYNEALEKQLPLGASVFDLASEAAAFGLTRWEDARLWFHSRHPFALDAVGQVASAGARLLTALRGRSRKCIVLDLDNTLWGGVVGDDGTEGIRIGPSGGATGEAYAAFQAFLKALSARGIALAVSSKNEDALAREPFRSRAEMLLSLEDFAVFRANWDNKADNLRAIAKTLNIGVDSLVFVDDNPAERALVRRELPEVAVVDMPADPAGFISALANGRWFETLQITDEDRIRAQAYSMNIKREEVFSSSVDVGAYLASLDMHATWGTAGAAQIPRMAQLLNKTNQFQLTERRFSEGELAAMSVDTERWWIGWFALRDRFGEHGVISMVALQLDDRLARVEAWPMSCRVFSRGMEDLIFTILCREAVAHGCTQLEGRYTPSAKNGVVAGLYERLGGLLLAPQVPPLDSGAASMLWRFDLNSRPTNVVHIVEHREEGAPPLHNHLSLS